MRYPIDGLYCQILLLLVATIAAEDTRCTEARAQECEAKLATCIVVRSQTECHCRQGSIAFGTNATAPEQFICLDLCQVLRRPEWLEKSCPKIAYQRCVSTDVQTSGLVDGTFIYNRSFIISTSAEHCQCEIGFRRNSAGHCTPQTEPIRYIREMNFDLDVPASATHTAKRIYVDTIIRPAFISLIRSLFKVPPIDYVTNCIIEAEVALCTTALSTVLSPEAVEERLDRACLPTRGSNSEKCLYKNSGKKILVREKKDLWVESFDYCATLTRCLAYPNSICTHKAIANNELFECLCDRNLFNVHASASLILGSKKNFLRMESCQLRDLCREQKSAFGCTDPNAICSLSVSYSEDGSKYTAESFCTCPKTNLTLSSRDGSCSLTCDGYCQNGGDCAVDMYNSKRRLCRCTAGFTGDRCDRKEATREPEVSNGVSSGYRTATIVLSVFLGISMLGLVFLFGKKYFHLVFKTDS